MNAGTFIVIRANRRDFRLTSSVRRRTIIMADGKTLSEITNGIFGYGNVGSSVGAYFYYHDSHDGGSYVSYIGTQSGSQAALRPLSPLPAVVPSNPGASARPLIMMCFMVK